MSEDLATEIALVLVRLGYRDVHEEAGLVYYTEADGLPLFKGESK